VIEFLALLGNEEHFREPAILQLLPQSDVLPQALGSSLV
jgi:hypothetical protein